MPRGQRISKRGLKENTQVQTVREIMIQISKRGLKVLVCPLYLREPLVNLKKRIESGGLVVGAVPPVDRRISKRGLKEVRGGGPRHRRNIRGNLKKRIESGVHPQYLVPVGKNLKKRIERPYQVPEVPQYEHWNLKKRIESVPAVRATFNCYCYRISKRGLKVFMSARARARAMEEVESQKED